MIRLPADQRRRDLAAIHTAKRDLGMADDTYRAVLWSVARVRSAGDLDQAGRSKVLDHFRACGWAPSPAGGRGRGVRGNEWAFIDRAAADRQPLLRKICAVCRSMGVGKTYAEGTAKRQTGLDRKLEMMDEGQLWLLAGVLERTRKHKEQNKSVPSPIQGEG